VNIRDISGGAATTFCLDGRVEFKNVSIFLILEINTKTDILYGRRNVK